MSHLTPPEKTASAVASLLAIFALNFHCDAAANFDQKTHLSNVRLTGSDIEVTTIPDFHPNGRAPTDPKLSEVKRIESDAGVVKFLGFASEHAAMREVWNVPEATLGPWLERDMWGPIRWWRDRTQSWLGHPVPPVQLTVLMVPEGIKVRRGLRTRVPQPGFGLAVGVAIPGEGVDAEERLLNAVVASQMFVHEATHVLARYPAYGWHRPANRISEEAYAYTFAHCAVVASGTTDSIELLSGIPIEPELGRDLWGVSSRELLRQAGEQLRPAIGRLSTSQKGSLLAAMGLLEANGGEGRVRDATDRARIDGYCTRLFETPVDWMAARPCQLDSFTELCLPLLQVNDG